MAGERSQKDYLVPALERGLLILEMFSRQDKVLTVTDFADRLGVSVSTVYRTVVTLVEMGYLEKVRRNNYRLGSRVLSCGFTFLASREIVEVAASHLLALRDSTSASCHLMVREGLEVIYLYRAPSPQRLVVNIPVGTRFGAHAVAGGRAILWGLSDVALGELYSGVALDRTGGNAPTSLPLLRQFLEREREQGYSLNRSDMALAVGVPVKDYAGEHVAAVNVSAPDTLMGDEVIRQAMIVQLQETAAKISQELGALQTEG